MKENILTNSKYTTILSILVLSLFIQIRFEVFTFIVRPFDLFTVFIFFYTFSIQKEITRQKLSSGFFYLLPFFFIHFISALVAGNQNFIKEFLQVIVFIAFAYILSVLINKIDYKKIITNVLQGSICIMIFSVLWHLYNGYLVGWKQLPDTRIIFTIVSILMFAYLNIYEKKIKNLLFIYIIFFVLILLSGERKALVIFTFLLIMHYSDGNFFKILIFSSLGYLILYLLGDYLDNSYLKSRINTLTNLFGTGKFQFFLDTGQLSSKDTYSNIQRVFSFTISKKFFLENPLLGIGTNNFINVLKDQFYYLPKVFLAGIHNEFQRVLVENGIIGLFCYLFIWFKSWTRTKQITFMAQKHKLINSINYKFCTYSLYITCIIYVGTEASSLRSFIILIFISLLPDYLKYHLSINAKNTKLN